MCIKLLNSVFEVSGMSYSPLLSSSLLLLFFFFLPSSLCELWFRNYSSWLQALSLLHGCFMPVLRFSSCHWVWMRWYIITLKHLTVLNLSAWLTPVWQSQTKFWNDSLFFPTNIKIKKKKSSKSWTNGTLKIQSYMLWHWSL